MKITMKKHDMTRSCQEHEVNMLEAAGWVRESSENVKAVDEVIRLKPPVKTKATVRALEEANDTKGDE